MLGGEVTTRTPESAGATVIETTAEGAADPVFGPSGPALAVFTAHNERAAATPPGAILLATNEACPVQAYRVGTHLYAAQFHPEPTSRDFADRMTFYRTTGYFAPEEFESAGLIGHRGGRAAAAVRGDIRLTSTHESSTLRAAQ